MINFKNIQPKDQFSRKIITVQWREGKVCLADHVAAPTHKEKRVWNVCYDWCYNHETLNNNHNSV